MRCADLFGPFGMKCHDSRGENDISVRAGSQRPHTALNTLGAIFFRSSSAVRIDYYACLEATVNTRHRRGVRIGPTCSVNVGAALIGTSSLNDFHHGNLGEKD